MKLARDFVLKSLGIWLLLTAYAKGWELLIEWVVDNYIWTHRPFELVLGIWLLSGKSKKTAWLVTLLCFSLFSVVPLYEGITGGESCGYFGSIQTNPWITLFAFYLPAVIALLIFRPKGERLCTWPSISPFKTTVLMGLVVLCVCAPAFSSDELNTIM